MCLIVILEWFKRSIYWIFSKWSGLFGLNEEYRIVVKSGLEWIWSGIQKLWHTEIVITGWIGFLFRYVEDLFEINIQKMKL